MDSNEHNVSSVIPLEIFKNIVGDAYVFTDDESLKHYSHDETENLFFLPNVVLKPRTAEEISKILKIDEKNLQVITEPGVITEVLQEAVKEKGLFYPPDPSSRGSCFIGGNIAENSGGPKAVKYGVVKDYVLNLEVVLPTGEIIHTGANILKNSTGYNLTQLVVGSEGTLGIVTRAVLKLIPLPKHDLLMLVPFPDAAQACAAVSAI